MKPLTKLGFRNERRNIVTLLERISLLPYTLLTTRIRANQTLSVRKFDNNTKSQPYARLTVRDSWQAMDKKVMDENGLGLILPDLISTTCSR